MMQLGCDGGEWNQGQALLMLIHIMCSFCRLRNFPRKSLLKRNGYLTFTILLQSGDPAKRARAIVQAVSYLLH